MNVTDPVCGMQVDDRQAVTSLNHQGQTYHFCCESCRRLFEKDPKAYLEGGAGEAFHTHGH
jgi:YHS domain-containing protein